MNKRSKESIYNEILQFCLEPRIKTHIMYATNTSSMAVIQYVGELLEKGFLVITEHGVSIKNAQDCIFYKTTEIGREYVSVYNRLISL